jgi:hypothetical protein
MLACALAFPVGFLTPLLVLAYSGRSENQHFSCMAQTNWSVCLFICHQCFCVFGNVGSLDA